MKKATSLQRRLGGGLILGMTLLWLIATALTVPMVRHALNATLDSALAETAQRILSLAVVEIVNRDNPELLQYVAPLRAHEEYLTYRVRDAAGNPLLASHDLDPAVFPERPRTGWWATATHRLYGTAAVSDTIFIEVAEPLTYRRRATWQAVAMLLLPLVLLIPLGLVGIWWFVHHSLQGVLAYRDAVEARGAGDLSRVEGGRLPAEIAPIAEAVNHLLERLRRVLEAERSFTANSAHELRTPVAAALAQAQRLRHEAPPGPLRDRAARIEETLHALSRLSEKLLQLAKAESGGLLAETPQDVRGVITHVVDELRRTHPARLELSLPGEARIVSSIDPDALAILLRNLVENALKHGCPERPVEVIVSSDGELRVINGGAVVPEQERRRLTRRFTRATRRVDGAGLGLAIASAIATGVGAQLVLASPAPGRADGFAASVRLPA